MLRPTPTTVEPLRVSPPEAVAYQFELTPADNRLMRSLYRRHRFPPEIRCLRNQVLVAAR